MTAPQDFGLFLRRHRELRGLSAQEVASQVGLEPAQLSGLEAGLMAPPGASALVGLVNALSLNPTDAQTLLDLAHQARTSEGFAEAHTAPPAAGPGLLQRAKERSAAEPAPGTAPPTRRPGPHTLIRGLRADMVASALEQADRDTPTN